MKTIAHLPSTRPRRSPFPRDWWLVPAGAALALVTVWGMVSSVSTMGGMS